MYEWTHNHIYFGTMPISNECNAIQISFFNFISSSFSLSYFHWTQFSPLIIFFITQFIARFVIHFIFSTMRFIFCDAEIYLTSTFDRANRKNENMKYQLFQMVWLFYEANFEIKLAKYAIFSHHIFSSLHISKDFKTLWHIHVERVECVIMGMHSAVKHVKRYVYLCAHYNWI